MPKSAFSEDQRRRIHQLCDEDHFSQSKVAQLYGVSQGTISNVLKEERYKAEIRHRDDMLEHGFTRGVQAAIEDGSYPDTSPTGYIDMND